MVDRDWPEAVLRHFGWGIGVDVAVDEDIQTLGVFVRTGSEQAFAELVKRYMKLVYSTCLRETGDPSLSEDAAQVVFVLLAQKARTVASYSVLSGWLFRTSRFVAKNMVSKQRRRQLLEAKAFDAAGRVVSTRDDWFTHERPLNDALTALKPLDREAVLLRYFEGMTTAEIAKTLSVTPDAAERRILRAIDKMRKHVAKHGVPTTAALIALLTLDVAKPAPAQCVEEALLNHAAASSAASAARAHQTAAHILQGILLRRAAAISAAVVLIIALAFAAASTIYGSRLQSSASTVRALPATEPIRFVPSHIDLGEPLNGLHTYFDVPFHATIDNGILSLTTPQGSDDLTNESQPGLFPTQPFEGNVPSNPAFAASPSDTSQPVADVALSPSGLRHTVSVWTGDLRNHPAVFNMTQTPAGLSVTDQAGKEIYRFDTIPAAAHFTTGEWYVKRYSVAERYLNMMLAQTMHSEKRQLADLHSEYVETPNKMSPGQLRAAKQAIVERTGQSVDRLYAKVRMALKAPDRCTTLVSISIDHGTMELRTGNDRFMALTSADIVTIGYRNSGWNTYATNRMPPNSQTIGPILPLYVPARSGEWHIIYRRLDGAFVVREVITMETGKVLRTFTDSQGNPAVGVYQGSPLSAVPTVVRTVGLVQRILSGLTGRP